MKKWVLILLMLLLTLPGYALITIEKKPGTGTLSGHLDDINANDLELDGKIDGKVSDDAFTSDWSTVTDVAPSQAALYNYLINFDADGDGLFSDEAWFPSIFDPAAPGEIGGTTPAAGAFTELTVGVLTSTPVDGENRLTFPDNTTRSPSAGAQEIYSEGGLMKYSENGVEKRFITIDDTAGDGDTGVALSADKIVELIEAGGSGVPDGTSTDDILSWDGDSWEPIALTAHPAFSALLAAFNSAGLNSFTFTTSVTYPIWAATSPVTVSFDVTDTSTTYAVADVDYQYDGAGGFVENMTNTTGDTWTADVTITTDGAHTIQLEAVDDKSTPNSGQSAVYTINFDGTDPVVGTITPSSLTHDGTGATLTATVASVTEPNELTRQWSLYDVTDAAIEVAWTTFTGLSITGITLPADQHTYRLDVRCTDLAGNDGTASSSNITYSGGASVEDTFTDTDSTALASHTSDSEHTWTRNGGGTIIVHTNHAESSQSTSAGLYYSSFVPTDADYAVTLDTVTAGTGVATFVAGRCSTSAVTMYGCRWNGTDTWELTRWVSGTRTVIGTYIGDSPVGSTRTVTLSMVGSTIAVSIGGVSRISVTDTGISTAGRPGIGTWYCDVPGYHNIFVDNFEVTD